MAEIIGLFTAALLLADRLVAAPASTLADADEHFTQLVRRRRRDAWLHRRTPLAVLDTTSKWTASARRSDLGVQPIVLDAIAGTVELAKSRHFDAHMRPDRSCAARWKPLWLACQRGDPLPPISVYLLDGRYWLRDGHHRVSVLRHQHAHTVDAEIIELVR